MYKYIYIYIYIFFFYVNNLIKSGVESYSYRHNVMKHFKIAVL